MSYRIKPNFRYNISTPLIEGIKKLKIELFQIDQFKCMWNMDTRHDFSPRLPFRHDDRIMFWDSDLYRIRLNGRWYKSDNHRYIFMTKHEVFERWV